MSTIASIISTQDSMMSKLLDFYSNPKNLEVLKKFNKDEKEETKIEKPNNKLKSPKMSIRLINWFCTNYAKQYNINYYITKRNKKVLFHVASEYKKESSNESKEYFDFFRRGAKANKLINLEYEENGELKKIKTTTAQLNAFRWAIQNNVISYIETNLKEIYEDQAKRGSNKNTIIYENGKVKKRQISENVTKKLGIINLSGENEKVDEFNIAVKIKTKKKV